MADDFSDFDGLYLFNLRLGWLESMTFHVKILLASQDRSLMCERSSFSLIQLFVELGVLIMIYFEQLLILMGLSLDLKKSVYPLILNQIVHRLLCGGQLYSYFLEP